MRSLPFTTIRIEAGEPLYWDRHVERLRETAAALALPIPVAKDLFRALPRAVGGTLRVRITLQHNGSLTVDAEPYADSAEPWSLLPVPVDPDRDLVRYKTTARSLYDAARELLGDEEDALLFREAAVRDGGQDSGDGTVLECTVANLFFEIEGRIVTPPASEALLPGIVRALVLERVPAACEAPVSRADAMRASACCVTNALIGVHPVGAVTRWRSFESVELARRLKDAIRAG